ncbi:type II toxin-antitoxin system mRNA interferase toxin, RelE/StbE family, partial [Escherichia coli]|uniref:type II toxin-antitoxin system mRNA interferase toxin, RelE/StbE family n=1 Tax=Escherichia coli TaxID=562 RepID=UPI002341E6FF
KLAQIREILISESTWEEMTCLFAPSQGSWKGYRDAHVEPDWILIYKLTDKLLRFERTGTHAVLFG